MAILRQVICIAETVLLLAVSTATYGQEFVVQPSDKVVAPNSMAHFHCVVTGDEGSYIKWRVNNEEIGDGDRQSFPYNASWYSHVNTTLSVSTSPQSNTNGSLVECVAAHLSSHFRRRASLIIAAPPLAPANFRAEYDRAETTVALQWSAPFTHLPQFPISSYTAEVEYLKTGGTTFRTANINIGGTDTEYRVTLSEDEVCSCSRVCVSLTARNSVGPSSATDRICTDIVREYRLFPVNTSLSMQPDGKTFVTVVFQKPQCFPQEMHSSIVVEEALPIDANIPSMPLYDWSDDELMNDYTIATMKEDMMYYVTVHLSSDSENATSLPALVGLPAQVTGSDNNDGSGGQDTMVLIIAVVVGTLVLAVLVIAALTTSIVVIVCVHRKQKDSNSTNHYMQPNPLYESGSLYATIPESFPPLPRPPSYDSHIYQSMPETGGRHNASTDLCAEFARQCAVVGLYESDGAGKSDSMACSEPEEEPAVVVEGDYVVMQSAAELPSSPLQTDV